MSDSVQRSLPGCRFRSACGNEQLCGVWSDSSEEGVMRLIVALLSCTLRLAPLPFLRLYYRVACEGQRALN